MYLPISRFFIYSLFFLGCLLTYAQDVSLIPTVDTLQKLDIQWFKENRSQNNGVVYLEDSTKIKLIWQPDFYREDISKKNSPYKLMKFYDKKIGIYQGGGIYFYSCRIGNWKDYDINNELINNQNYDQDYPFTYTQVIDKIKKEYHIDLEKEFGKREYIDVRRGWDKKNPYDYPAYVVVYTLTPEELKNYHPDPRVGGSLPVNNYYYNTPRRYIFIDGRTGKTELDMASDEYYAIAEYYKNKIQREKITENSPSKVPNY
ncbi:hypothetical protein [Apibacter adventoris]|uniref:Uncharacterized protein n=1 Tax=Apibacter adventoris TaxID=1679466 RepID=A0A2S8AF01_9FLAO|nr:hypothetical protein [Apibacter adventoris]PQL91167.1 hypothetical protein C4S77_08795 [Apibacter adventoris]PQL93991.1 hypothetical protein C4S77_04190 [Apibacter adventoris]